MLNVIDDCTRECLCIEVSPGFNLICPQSLYQSIGESRQSLIIGRIPLGIPS